MTGVRSLKSLAFLLLMATAVNENRVFATPPFSPTVVEERNGRWELRHGYVGGTFIFVMDKDDEVRLELPIRDALPKDDLRKYVHETSAGPLWGTYAVSYFVMVNGQSYFCIRTWWDRRIVIDLKAAKQVSDVSLEKDLTSTEREKALATLERTAALVGKGQGIDEMFAVYRAVHLAGRMKLKQAIPHLKRLETISYISESGGSLATDKTWETNGDPSAYRLCEIRRLVQFALRRLGERPEGYPALQMQFADDKSFEKPVKARPERIQQVALGMTPKAVRAVLGDPDDIDTVYAKRTDRLDYVWRYDVDEKEPYTVLVIFGGDTKLRLVDQICPALWRENELFKATWKEPILDADGSILFPIHSLYTGEFGGRITRLKPPQVPCRPWSR